MAKQSTTKRSVNHDGMTDCATESAKSCQSHPHAGANSGSHLNTSPSGPKVGSDSDAHGIFADRHALFTANLATVCDAENVNYAVAVIDDPKLPEPLVFVRGNEYDAARMIAYILRKLTKSILDKITP